MDNPIGATERAGGSARTDGLGPAIRRQQGVMGGRRVSATAPKSQVAAVATASTPTGPPGQCEWISGYRQLAESIRDLERCGSKAAAKDFRTARKRVDDCVKYRFNQVGGKLEDVPLQSRNVCTAAERKYLAVEARVRGAEESGTVAERRRLKFQLESLHYQTNSVLADLTGKYGSVEARAIQPRLLPVSPASGAVTQPVSKPVAALSETPPPVTLPAGTTVPIDGHIGPPEAMQSEGSWVDEFVTLERALNQTEPPTN